MFPCTKNGHFIVILKSCEAFQEEQTVEVKKWLMNTTTLKSVFKAVYGMPIASYMKEYRMKLASNMLLQEDKGIAILGDIGTVLKDLRKAKEESAFV